MPKSQMNTTLNYSPNFDVKKRRVREVKFIIFHYTGMKKENQAITRLTNSKSKVSSHYLIKNNGEILTLVPDLYVAWHAGPLEPAIALNDNKKIEIKVSINFLYMNIYIL
jgi:N-acetylmuramoyl-L-alanine amidase